MDFLVLVLLCILIFNTVSKLYWTWRFLVLLLPLFSAAAILCWPSSSALSRSPLLALSSLPVHRRPAYAVTVLCLPSSSVLCIAQVILTIVLLPIFCTVAQAICDVLVSILLPTYPPIIYYRVSFFFSIFSFYNILRHSIFFLSFCVNLHQFASAIICPILRQ